MEWGVKCYLHDSPVLHNNTNKRASAQRAPRKQLGQLCQTHAIISVSFGSYFENSNSGLGHEWFFLYCEMEGHLSTKCTTCAWFIIKHVSVCRYLQRSTELTFCLQTLTGWCISLKKVSRMSPNPENYLKWLKKVHYYYYHHHHPGVQIRAHAERKKSHRAAEDPDCFQSC